MYVHYVQLSVCVSVLWGDCTVCTRAIGFEFLVIKQLIPFWKIRRFSGFTHSCNSHQNLQFQTVVISCLILVCNKQQENRIMLEQNWNYILATTYLTTDSFMYGRREEYLSVNTYV